jgi:septum formation topological specificity factor MinE
MYKGVCKMDYIDIIENLAKEILDTIAEYRAVYEEKAEILQKNQKNLEKNVRL